MFSFFNFGRPKAHSEADFDVLDDVTGYEVTLTKDELTRIFLDWTQTPSTMTREELGRMIADRCASFNARFSGRISADKDAIAKIFAIKVIEALIAKKVITKSGRKKSHDFGITKRGEQVRQYYVLKLGLRGSLYDRMDQFASA